MRSKYFFNNEKNGKRSHWGGPMLIVSHETAFGLEEITVLTSIQCLKQDPGSLQ